MRIPRNVACTGALGLFGMMAACSSPTTPAAQAAASIYMKTPANAGPMTGCTPGAHWVNVPFAAAAGQQTSGTAKANPSAVDGEAGMSVTCTVQPNGDRFNVNASLKSPAIDPQSGMPVNPTLITLVTTIGNNETNVPGSLSVLDSKTTSSYSSSECLFSTQPRTGEQLQVASGRIWAAVTCASLRDQSSPDMGATCQVETGYFVLENCQE